MANDKKFTISFDAKLQGLKDAKQALQEILNLSPKLQKAFANITIGGAGGMGASASGPSVHGYQGLAARGLAAQVRDLKTLGTTAREVSSILDTQANRAFSKLDRQIEHTRKHIISLNSSLKDMTAQGVPASDRKYQRTAARLERVSMGLSGLMNQRAAADAFGTDLMTVGGTGAASLFGNAGVNLLAARQLMQMMGLGGLAGAVGPIGAMYAGWKTVESANASWGEGARRPFEVQARLAQAQNASYMQALHGNLENALGEGIIRGDPQKRENLRVMQQSAVTGEQMGNLVGYAKDFGLGVVNMFRGVDSPFKAMQERYRNSDSQYEAAARNAELEAVGLAAKLKPIELAKANFLFGNAQGIANYNYRFGAGGWDSSFGHGIFGAQMRQGMETASMSGMGVGGAKSDSFKRDFVEAVKTGMNEGIAASVIGRTAVGGGNVIAAMRGLEGTHKDVLSQAITSMYGPDSMNVDATGLAEVLRRNVGGGALGMTAAQQNISGLSAMANVSGMSPYNNFLTTVHAGTAMPNASPYQLFHIGQVLGTESGFANALAGKEASASSVAMLGEGATGILQEAANLQFRQLTNPLMNTGENTRAMDRLAEIQSDKYQGNLKGYLDAERDRGKTEAEKRKNIEEAAQDLGPLISAGSGGRISIGTGIGQVRIAGGLSADSPDATNGASGMGGLLTTAQRLEKTFQSLNGGVKNFGDTLQTIIDALNERLNNPNGNVEDPRNAVAPPPPQYLTPAGHTVLGYTAKDIARGSVWPPEPHDLDPQPATK